MSGDKHTILPSRTGDRYRNSWRDLSDADLARYLTNHRRALILLDGEVADPDVRESTRAWLRTLIADAGAEDERRERAAELGVPRDARAFPVEFLAHLKASIRLDEMVAHELGALLGRQSKAGVRRGPCPLCKSSPDSDCFIVHLADPAEQWWYCFRCLAGGDAIDLIVQAYGDSFPDAVRRLAAHGHIPLPAPPTQTAQPAKRLNPHGRRVVPLRGAGRR